MSFKFHTERLKPDTRYSIGVGANSSTLWDFLCFRDDYSLGNKNKRLPDRWTAEQIEDFCSVLRDRFEQAKGKIQVLMIVAHRSGLAKHPFFLNVRGSRTEIQASDSLKKGIERQVREALGKDTDFECFPVYISCKSGELADGLNKLENELRKKFLKTSSTSQTSQQAAKSPSRTRDSEQSQALLEEEYEEGRSIQALGTRYERDPKARAACLDHHGFICSICEVDLQAVYGEIAKGFIHVHHLRELAAEKEARKTDPINDLVPVCPNCHAMLHRKKPAYGVDELREVLKALRRK